MRTIKKYLKSTALVLAMIILFQGCSAYHSTILFKKVTLDTVVEKETKTKLVMTNGTTFKYWKIEHNDGHYYGIKKVNGELTKYLINPNEIKTIEMGPKSMSTSAVIGISLAFAAITYFLITNIDIKPTISSKD